MRGVMSKSGFLKFPRSFYDDPIWQSFSVEYRSIFMTLLVNFAWKDTIQDDHGQPILVKIGQCLMTERQIINESFPEKEVTHSFAKCKSLVHRSLHHFKKVGFSNHETNQQMNQKKTLHTLLREDLLNMFEPSFEPRFEPKTNLERTLKEEDKNKEVKEHVCLSVLREAKKEGEELKELICMKSRKTQSGVTTDKRSDVIEYLKKHEEHFTEEEILDSIKTMEEQDQTLNGTIKNYLIGVIRKKREQKKNEQHRANNKHSKHYDKYDPVQRSSETFTESSVSWKP